MEHLIVLMTMQHVVVCYASNIGVSIVLHIKLTGVILAIEIAFHEVDIIFDQKLIYKLVRTTFKQLHVILLTLHKKWKKCTHLNSQTHFKVTHIFREENCRADKMISIDLSTNSFTWWNNLSNSIFNDFNHNRLVLPFIF